MNYDWNDLRCFLRVAQTGSLSAAARQLDISQPTIGRRIKGLEHDLNAQLLKRDSGRYHLTTIGQSVFELAKRMESSALAVERRVTGRESTLSGRVCLTSTECLATSWLLAQLPECATRYPGVDIDVVVSIDRLDLFRQEADIALRVGDPGPESVRRSHVGRAAFGLFASRDYIEAHGAPRELAEVAHHATIESVRELSNLTQVRELRRHALRDTRALSSNSILAQHRAAANGVGIATLPCYLANYGADYGHPGLIRLLADEFNIILDVWVVMHRDVADMPRFTRIRDFLIECMQRDQGYFLS